MFSVAMILVPYDVGSSLKATWHDHACLPCNISGIYIYITLGLSIYYSSSPAKFPELIRLSWIDL